MLVDTATPQERAHLLGIATRTGLFDPEEAEDLLGGILDRLERNDMP